MIRGAIQPPISSAGSGVMVGAAPHTTGVLPSQAIRGLIQNHRIESVEEIQPDQIQPASLDLRLGNVAYRVRASFMPGAGATMMDKVEKFGMHEIDISNGAVLERGCVYIVPLLESIRLNGDLAGFANPKSSTGRLDVFTRLITDRATTFDLVERNYHGPLFVEIAPRTFSIAVRKGSRLNQIRLRRGSPVFGKETLQRLHEEVPLIDAEPGTETIREKRVGLTIDLEGDPETGLVGFRAKRHTDVIDVDARGAYDPAGYWEPIHSRPGEGIILDPHDFYILATKEAVTVPPTHAAEMVAYDTKVGEFRVHYAGFFDPGFGYGRPEDASKAVLEVRSHEVPFMLEHEQIIGWLRYERLIEAPERIYGQDIGSTYQGQGLTLGKQFKPFG
ncbi:MAG: 2'-deoxycytidine 5'-triphosphate deaminase [Alphaproteobacteria bacterium]